MTHDPCHLPRSLSDLCILIGESIQDDFCTCDYKRGSNVVMVTMDGKEYRIVVEET